MQELIGIPIILLYIAAMFWSDRDSRILRTCDLVAGGDIQYVPEINITNKEKAITIINFICANGGVFYTGNCTTYPQLTDTECYLISNQTPYTPHFIRSVFPSPTESEEK